MSGIEEQKVVSVPNFGTEEKQNMKKRIYCGTGRTGYKNNRKDKSK